MWLAWLVACGVGPEAARVEAEEQVLDTMEQHWDEAEAMRDAVVAGDLEQVHDLAGKLQARMPIEGLPKDLEPLAAPLAEQAAAAGAAPDLRTAGLAVGRMAAACGSCHLHAKVVPALESRLRPSTRSDPAPEMVWHHLAEAKLWAGLVRHDDAAMKEAAEQLGKAVFHVDDGSQPGADLQALEQQVQQLAHQAATEAGMQARGEALGKLLGTCAACHAKAGVEL